MLPYLIFLDEPIKVVDWTAAADWTDIDISPYVDGVPRILYLGVTLYINHVDTVEVKAYFRKKGSSATAGVPTVGVVNELEERIDNSFFVECNADGIFQAKLEEIDGDPDTITLEVYLMGWSA